SLRSWAAPRKTWSWRQSARVWLCTARLLFLLEIGLDLAGELDGERVALAIDGLADGDADPALAHAIFLDVGLLLAVELDADALLQQGLVIVRALGIGRETVGQGTIGHARVCTSSGGRTEDPQRCGFAPAAANGNEQSIELGYKQRGARARGGGNSPRRCPALHASLED